MKKSGGSESTIIIGPSKSVPVYALHSLEDVLGLDRFRVFVPKLYYLLLLQFIFLCINQKIGLQKLLLFSWRQIADFINPADFLEA